jgi:hypothetical protein
MYSSHYSEESFDDFTRKGSTFPDINGGAYFV